MTSGCCHAADALLPTGWARDVLLEWDGDGVFTAVTPQSSWERSTGVARAAGPVLPGMPNLHSHTFQRVFAGLAERSGATTDSFWSWRDRMYHVASAVTPEDVAAIATHLFIEMLEAGFTSVCEFHYLHNDLDGRPYADRAALARCLADAGARTGIGLTMLPVLYQQSGFGGAPPNDGQRRFVTSTDALLDLVATLRTAYGQTTRIGLALHSLRAVTPEAMRDALDGLSCIDATAPVHIHVAEQTREVDECMAWSGARPVAWLLDHAPVDRRWCLVHATHMDDDEAARAAASGAVAGLCPSTEANLGDGIFDLPRWGAGRWGVGSDSHVTVDPADELRMLEYSQRLATGRRTVGATGAQPHAATALTLGAAAGGAVASGRPVGALVPGARADFVVLDGNHPAIAGLPAPAALDAHVFASGRNRTIAAVVVGGRSIVDGGRHPMRERAAEDFVRVRSRLAIRAAGS